MSSRLSIILLWVSCISLLVIGLVMVASTGLCVPDNSHNGSDFLIKQCSFAGVGLAAAIFISGRDYKLLRRFAWPIWIICCILLIMCFMPVVGQTLNGESRWIKVGIVFQPSEVAKICMMVALAHWYTTHREVAGTFTKGFAIPGIIFGFPLMLILMEKDMGTAAALGISGFCLMFVAGTRWWLLLLAFIVGACVLYWFTTSSGNRMERISAWLNPEAYKQGMGLQQWVASHALARGGLNGLGLGNGISKFGELPYAHTDFIFAEIGEELGFIGAGLVVFFFSLMAFSGFMLALRTHETFGRLLVIGLVCTIFWPAMLNVMVVTSILPNTGLPLPFISYGGTNLIFTIAAVGIITSVQRHSSGTAQQPWLKPKNKTQTTRL